MSFESSKLEGEIGEQMFIDFLNCNNIKFIDVRDDELCQWLDIDFIILKNNHTKEEVLKHIRSGNEIERRKRIDEIGYAVEVKVDKVIHCRDNKNGKITYGTNNLVYEIISHNMPGCLARCYSDYILYVCMDVFEPITKLSEVYLIDLYRWRQAIGKSIRDKEKVFLKSLECVKENGKEVKEDIVNILYSIDNIKEKKEICKNITDKFKNLFPKDLYFKKK